MRQDLIGRMATNDKMSIEAIAESFQDFIVSNGHETQFCRLSGKGKSTTPAYEELERRCGLEPHAEWVMRRMRENLAGDFPNECQGMRQTGRTTRMLLNAILAAVDGRGVVIYCHKYSKRHMADKLEALLDKASIEHKSLNLSMFNVGTGTIRLSTSWLDDKGYRDDRVFYDNALSDA